MEGKRRAEGLWNRFLKQKYLWVLVVPGLIWITIFCYVPLYGVTLAFKDYVPRLGITGSPWVGLEYFRELFSDSYFWNALRNTLMYGFLNLLVGFPVPIIFAVLLNELFNMDGFKKGIVLVNGFNLGRYWEVGPQKSLYIPAPILKAQNEIVILELDGFDSPEVTIDDTPDIG